MSSASFRREEPNRMKKGNTTKFRLRAKSPPKTDWRAFDAMSEEERHAAALPDPDCPPATRRSSHVGGGGEPESESSYLGFAAEACHSILSCRLRLMNASKSKGVEMLLLSPSMSAARRVSSSFSAELLGM